MKAQPAKGIDSEFYFDELLERASDEYDPYGYVDGDETYEEEVYGFDWEAK